MKAGGRTRARLPLIRQYSRRRGLLPSSERMADDLRRLQLAPRQGGVVNVYRVGGGAGAGGGGSGTDPDAIHDNVAGEISAITEKVTPVAADVLVIESPADGNAKKRVQVGNLPGGAGGGHTIQEDGTPLTARANLNFRRGVEATDGGAGPASSIVDLLPSEFTFDAVVDGVGGVTGFYATLQAAVNAGAVAILVIVGVAAETVTISADSVKLVQALHRGIAGPTITVSDPDVIVRGFRFTDEVVTLDAARVRLEDCVFAASASTRSGVDVTANGDGAIIRDCLWESNHATYAIDILTNATDVQILDSIFLSGVDGTNVIRIGQASARFNLSGLRFQDCLPTGFVILCNGTTSAGPNYGRMSDIFMNEVLNGGIQWRGQLGSLSNFTLRGNTGTGPTVPLLDLRYAPTFICSAGLLEGTLGTFNLMEDNGATVGHALGTRQCVAVTFRKTGGTITGFKAVGSTASNWIIGNCAFDGVNVGADVNSKGAFAIIAPQARTVTTLVANPAADTLVRDPSPGNNPVIAEYGHQYQTLDDTHDFGTAALQTRYLYGKPVLRTYTVATRPVGVPGGTIIFVSDGGAGAVFQGYNGAAWVNLG